MGWSRGADTNWPTEEEFSAAHEVVKECHPKRAGVIAQYVCYLRLHISTLEREVELAEARLADRIAAEAPARKASRRIPVSPLSSKKGR